MTPEERVNKIAEQECGLSVHWDRPCHPQCPTPRQLFVREIRAVIELCAKVAEGQYIGRDISTRGAVTEIAAKIREAQV